jgi:hypothetical protein
MASMNIDGITNSLGIEFQTTGVDMATSALTRRRGPLTPVTIPPSGLCILCPSSHRHLCPPREYELSLIRTYAADTLAMHSFAIGRTIAQDCRDLIYKLNAAASAYMGGHQFKD